MIPLHHVPVVGSTEARTRALVNICARAGLLCAALPSRAASPAGTARNGCETIRLSLRLCGCVGPVLRRSPRSCIVFGFACFCISCTVLPPRYFCSGACSLSPPRPAQTTIYTTPNNHKSAATRRPRQPHGGDFEMHHSTRTAAIPQLKGATPNEFKPGVRLTAALPPPPQPTTTNARARKHTGTDPGLHRPASRVALASNCRSHRRSGQSTTPDGASGTPAVRRTGLPSRVPAVGFEPTRSYLQWISSPPP